jgi:hypothetical protein
VELAERARADRNHVLTFSALLELNTGVPYTLEPTALDGVPQERWLDLLTEKVQALTPEIDAPTIERILLQYPMQVRAQHLYQLKPYDGKVLLVEPVTRYEGLIRAQLRPYVKDLTAKTCRVGEPTERLREVARRFGVLDTHFRSMRDDRFVDALAKVLDRHLG